MGQRCRRGNILKSNSSQKQLCELSRKALSMSPTLPTQHVTNSANSACHQLCELSVLLSELSVVCLIYSDFEQRKSTNQESGLVRGSSDMKSVAHKENVTKKNSLANRKKK